MGRTHLSGSQALRGSRLVVKAPTTRLKRAGGYRVAPVAPRFPLWPPLIREISASPLHRRTHRPDGS